MIFRNIVLGYLRRTIARLRFNTGHARVWERYGYEVTSQTLIFGCAGFSYFWELHIVLRPNL